MSKELAKMSAEAEAVWCDSHKMSLEFQTNVRKSFLLDGLQRLVDRDAELFEKELVELHGSSEWWHGLCGENEDGTEDWETLSCRNRSYYDLLMWRMKTRASHTCCKSCVTKIEAHPDGDFHCPFCKQPLKVAKFEDPQLRQHFFPNAFGCGRGCQSDDSVQSCCEPNTPHKNSIFQFLRCPQRVPVALYLISNDSGLYEDAMAGNFHHFRQLGFTDQDMQDLRDGWESNYCPEVDESDDECDGCGDPVSVCQGSAHPCFQAWD